MRFASRARLYATLAAVTVVAAHDGAESKASSQTPAATGGVASINSGPVPEAGPLGQPKSVRQVGFPVVATEAATPLDNPQTPEKIALGKKLFFDGRLSADGTVACSHLP